MLVNPLCMLKLIDFPLFIGIFSILRVCSRVFTIHFLLCSFYKAKKQGVVDASKCEKKSPLVTMRR